MEGEAGKSYSIGEYTSDCRDIDLAYIDMSGTLKVLSPVRQYMLNKERVGFDHISILEKWYINFIDQYSMDRMMHLQVEAKLKSYVNQFPILLFVNHAKQP
jgi:hypothetical protein